MSDNFRALIARLAADSNIGGLFLLVLRFEAGDFSLSINRAGRVL